MREVRVEDRQHFRVGLLLRRHERAGAVHRVVGGVREGERDVGFAVPDELHVVDGGGRRLGARGGPELLVQELGESRAVHDVHRTGAPGDDVERFPREVRRATRLRGRRWRACARRVAGDSHEHDGDERGDDPCGVSHLTPPAERAEFTSPTASAGGGAGASAGSRQQPCGGAPRPFRRSPEGGGSVAHARRWRRRPGTRMRRAPFRP